MYMDYFKGRKAVLATMRGKIEEQLARHENVDMAAMVSLGNNQNEMADMEEFEIDAARTILTSS